jgi:two-component system, sensor histidine kinase YesM
VIKNPFRNPGFEKLPVWQPFNHLSISRKMVIYFFILIIPTLTILGLFSYLRAEKAIRENVSKYVEDMLKQSSSNIDLYFQEADSIMASIIYDETIRDDLYRSQTGEYEKARANTEVNHLLSGAIYPREYARQLFIVDNDGTLFTTNSNVDVRLVKQQQWYRDIASGKVKKLIVPSHDSSAYTGGQYVKPIGEVFTLLREYRDIERNKLLGIIAIDIDYKVIEENFRKLNAEKDNGEIEIITKSGAIVYSKDRKNIGEQLQPEAFEGITAGNGSYISTQKGKKMLIVYTTSDVTGWKTIERIPMQSLMKDASEVKYVTVVVMALCMLFSMTLSLLLSHSITNPILKLIKKMKNIEKGDFDTSMEVTSKDEVGQLARSFNHMADEIKALIARIYEQEREKRRIELHMLQQQINPHFLYNTLDSINWMARMQNSPNISAAVTSLTQLLRISVHNSKEFNTIKDELEYLKSYVNIQKLRYGNMFDIVFNVDEEIMDCSILKLLLQPLVENALLHGLNSIRDGGIIKVEGRLEEDSIILCIEDNGKGMTREEIEGALSEMPKKADSFSGIGIFNIVQRIKLYYGDKYGLTYKSEPGRGTTAIVVIPASIAGANT